MSKEFQDSIESALQNRISQDQVDALYDSFCKEYHEAMDKHLHYVETLPDKCRKYKSNPKPWWNDELEKTWKHLVRKERELKEKNSVKKKRLVKKNDEFKKAQQTFDRLYRKCKREYVRKEQMELEELNTKDPREFWNQLKRLGPKNQNIYIPLQTVKANGEITNDLNEVIQIWCDAYKSLYTPFSNDSDFDEKFYDEIKTEKANLEKEFLSHDNVDGNLNMHFTFEEVRAKVMSSKNRKAVGLDNLPYEIFKTCSSISILRSLFDVMFQNRRVPSLWMKAIIKPLPKSSMSDPRLPLQYRGISLLSTVGKLYSSVLNHRLSAHAEVNDLFVEEQNGFRRKRSCEEHIFTLTSIIRNRKSKGLNTFAGYVDMEKAFDKVDRTLLLYVLLDKGINGNMYSAIKSMYENNEYSVSVNNIFTPWFGAMMGVRQGDCLSSTLFALYIDNLARKIKSLNSGICIDDVNVSILLFADDIVLIAESEEKLQYMFDEMYNWCHQWRLKVNCDKTKVVHFRPQSKGISKHKFLYGNHEIEKVHEYKYLGIVMDEHLEYANVAKVLSGAAGRALGKLYTVYKGFNGLGYNSYKKLYESYVDAIILYCAGTWGAKNISYCESIQNRAIRSYLGVHRFTPNLAINGDMGWKSTQSKRQICMCRLWNRLVTMDVNRLPRKIFDWDFKQCYHNWSGEMRELLKYVDMEASFHTKSWLDCKEIDRNLYLKQKEEWEVNVKCVSKLRTYNTFKVEYATEPYVTSFMSKGLRSALAQFRCGVLPLNIETGRYVSTPVFDRVCELCMSHEIEDETHFLIECPFYEEERKKLFKHAEQDYKDFNIIDNDVKLVILVSDEELMKFTAKYIQTCYRKRAAALNK